MWSGFYLQLPEVGKVPKLRVGCLQGGQFGTELQDLQPIHSPSVSKHSQGVDGLVHDYLMVTRFALL
jgi:hypothetical protein